MSPWIKPLLWLVGTTNVAAGIIWAAFHDELFRLFALPETELTAFLQTAGTLVLLLGIGLCMAAREPRRHRGMLALAFAAQVVIALLMLYYVGRGRMPATFLPVVLFGQLAFLPPLGMILHRLYATDATDSILPPADLGSHAPSPIHPAWIRAGWIALIVVVLAPTVWATGRAAFDIRRWLRVGKPLVLKPVKANLPRSAGLITPLSTELAFPYLRFVDPTFITPIPDGSNRLIVLERPGRIYVLPNRVEAAQKSLFLDISDRTMQVANKAEDGLFCIAFHPQYAEADSPHCGEFFVHYTAEVNGHRFNRLSKFHVPQRSNQADPASETVLIDTPDENQSHNGGTVTFGPDGFLYLALGDDGKRHPNPHAQNIRGDLFSGILRIDVDCRGGEVSHPPPRQPVKGTTAHYYVPNDNPFVGMPGALEEFYAIGLRNPWRMSFDSEGRLWVSDVGDLRREEINLVEKGANCGWAYAEGTALCKSYDPKAPDKPKPYHGHETWPVFEYERDAMNRCVIGGYVYRGSQFPELRGKYVYADQSGRIYVLELDENDKARQNKLVAIVGDAGLGISSFGEDAEGELFICLIKDLTKESGEIHRLVRARVDATQKLPQWLSETRLFGDLPTLTPAPELIPYEVNSPLWSDRAVKKRWIGLPANSKITGDLSGPWRFPVGTVFVKHFDLPLDESRVQGSGFRVRGSGVRSQESNDGSTVSGWANGPPTQAAEKNVRRLETRILVCDNQGAVYAATYRWNDDLRDAKLVEYSQTEDIEYLDADGKRQTQTWLYPGRFECLACHNPPAGYVLGFNAKQLNREVSAGGGIENQLARFANAGLLDIACTDEMLEKSPTLVAIDDPHASLETRVRSYLDANCSHCHRPGHRFGAWDARFEASLESAGIVDGTSYMHQVGNPLARVVRPGDLKHSFLHVRLASNEMTLKMPPLARNVIDRRAAEAVAQWIESLPPPAPEVDARLEDEHR